MEILFHALSFANSFILFHPH